MEQQYEETEGEQVGMFEADITKEPKEIRQVMEELGLLGPHVKAKELVGETFIILKAKTFKGKGDPDYPPYYCHCTDMKKSEVFTTVLGGQAVVDMLKTYFEQGPADPLKVTLGWVEAGEFGGYYIFE